jgi:hypothetical protein
VEHIANREKFDGAARLENPETLLVRDACVPNHCVVDVSVPIGTVLQAMVALSFSPARTGVP